MAPRISASAPLDELPQPAPQLQRVGLSFEVMPPRQDHPDELLSVLESYGPDYVAVTSSRRSGWLEGTANFISEISASSSMRPLAHLACSAGTEAELRHWTERLIDAGVRGFLALRGDVVPQPGYLQHADALVRLIRQVEGEQVSRLAAGRLAVAVACYPNGHEESKTPSEDFEVLLAKQRLGADLALSQLFFEAEDFLRFRARADLFGIRIPLVPGVMPITSLRRLQRMSELTGLAVPRDVGKRMEAVEGTAREYDVGLELTAQLVRRLVRSGVTGIHLYTFNNPQVVQDVLQRVDI